MVDRMGAGFDDPDHQKIRHGKQCNIHPWPSPFLVPFSTACFQSQ